jgi:outer membrane protein OmpA-like peptidoglycan-associated protein
MIRHPPTDLNLERGMRVRGLTVALLLLTATAASAQTAGSYEIDGFGRNTRFDDALALNNRFGGGGALGFFLLSNLALEAEGAYTATHDPLNFSVTNIPLRGRLSYHIPLGGNALSIRLGAGYVRNLYRKDVSFDDDGFTGIVGVRVGLGPTLGLRLDGTADYFRSPDAGRVNNYVNWGGQAGLSFVFGNSSSSSSDKDRDAVPDRSDRCPGTPVGKSVDSSGCAASQLDGDRDRVNDEADRCPNTPAGESVDADGCSASQKDADRDGVLDTVDRCPRTPAGERVNSDGCSDSQRDDDADGVLNNADRCPASRPGQQVDASGCAVATPAAPAVAAPASPQDSDKDGVVDSADQCPNTPAGELVNSRGCTRDTDGDGVPDSRDHCGSTPPGEKIDENGCPILFKKGARSVILKGVTFQTGRARLTPEGRAVLRDIASQLVENPDYRVQISGHTDNTGSRAANLRLSLARARTVETFLEANGVPPRQVTSKGFGPDVPIASNKTAAGRAMNRRVELNRTN